jgi:enoyl-[acyl-carrier protein] reductase I
MTAGLMQGKRGLVMGVANDHSIAWGIARRLAAAGAELAFTFQPPSLDKRVRPLAASVGSVFDAVAARWGGLDFIVHAIAFSDKNELKGRYADTSRANFKKTMLISCFSFTEVAKRAAALMPNGGAMVTLTYGGSMRVQPNYNVMGVAKAALEASVRYLAYDFGEQNVRVNAISAGPVRTLAGSGISDARIMYNYQRKNSPLRRSVTLDEIGNTALYLLSDLASAVTGEIHFVDSGYNIVSMPRLSGLKTLDEPNEGNGRDEATGREAAE